MMRHTFDEAGDGCDRMVHVDDISWTLPPLPLAEDIDLLMLDDEELLAYARDLQHETRALRLVLRDTIAALAHTAAQRDRAIFTVRRQTRLLERVA